MSSLLPPFILLILIGMAAPLIFKLMGIINWSWLWTLSPFWIAILAYALYVLGWLAVWAWNTKA